MRYAGFRTDDLLIINVCSFPIDKIAKYAELH